MSCRAARVLLCLVVAACSGTDLDRGDSSWNDGRFDAAHDAGQDAAITIDGESPTLDAGGDGSAPNDARIADVGVGDATSDAGCTGLGCVLQHARLTSNHADVDDWFGGAVALSGDTLVVGVPMEDSAATGVDGDATDNSAEESGAAYVFVRTGDTWNQQAYLKASGARSPSFGWSVSVSGDTAVVGGSGAYVFVRDGSTWTQQTEIYSDGMYRGWGESVAVSGDTLVIGTQGVAEVFVRSGATWTQQARLEASREDSDIGLSSVIAISGETIVVGGSRRLDDGTVDGAAYAFVRNGTTWHQEARLTPTPDPVVCFRCDRVTGFGGSVAISGDTVVVGAAAEDSNAIGVNGSNRPTVPLGVGSAYIFVRHNGAWTQQARVRPEQPTDINYFGVGVAVSGDYAVIGAADTGANDRVYLFHRDEHGWNESRILTGDRPSGRFGTSVAITSDAIAVGSWAEDDYAGAAYVFR